MNKQPSAQAANIISFDDNATACGGAVLCSTDGTHGYIGAGGQPFDITTITSWFQVDASTSQIPGQPAQPANAGDFLVANNTGAVLTGLTLTITDNFVHGGASVHPCTGLQAGYDCDNFQANKGAAGTGTSFETLSGLDFDRCTDRNGATPCTSTAGSAAADFKAGDQITYIFGGYDIAAGATFDINFASWNNAAFATPTVPEPATWAMMVIGLAGLGFAGYRRPRRTAIEIAGL